MCGFSVFTGKVEEKEFEEKFDLISHRGPDQRAIHQLAQGTMGFHRLAIMDLSEAGSQPFISKSQTHLVCNGEIYNHRILKTDYIDRYEFKSDSDCEVIIPIFEEYGIKKLLMSLDGEFAFVIEREGKYYAGRDPIGIRPLFYGYGPEDGKIAFASEVKALQGLCKDIKPFPPGHYYADGEFTPYFDVREIKPREKEDLEAVYQGIHDHLVEGVRKRLDADAPVGFLLSGGLDSSLVCAIAAKLSDRPIKTFAVGIDTNPIDLKYARIVADYLGSEHHEVIFTKEEAFEHLRELVHKLETWDITTIRASMGMSLVCKYIREKTDVKVVLTGEVSDELFGYKYTDFAPSPLEFQKEAQKRVHELYLYDVLRADRSISSHSLEARVPFSDKAFIEYVMGIAPELKMNWSGEGKFLLRKAFDHSGYLPNEILWREKAAFSDAVGHDMVDWLKALAGEKYSEEELSKASEKYPYATPFTKESLMYRDLFEEHFPGLSGLITDFWMPNKEWENCQVDDPSARVLPNYGASGE
ncbi:putative asparagine synthase (glutamine-hydrolyzing) [Bacteriovorax sp. BAL6_X]|uniref:asparagine synthase B n=1 Tax=Bacteriovorax sp. BAL6_X TaxID=1201290 RepID=UPI000386E49E|nr:asparagine synthase B [Bacteriovorax sp. BAL6_X]EPZ51767.1 putative asparagine synthase (glutamine-hydrolyzing) [Bacteriovorax sp. BAL6_X]